MPNVCHIGILGWSKTPGWQGNMIALGLLVPLPRFRSLLKKYTGDREWHQLVLHRGNACLNVSSWNLKWCRSLWKRFAQEVWQIVFINDWCIFIVFYYKSFTNFLIFARSPSFQFFSVFFFNNISNVLPHRNVCIEDCTRVKFLSLKANIWYCKSPQVLCLLDHPPPPPVTLPLDPVRDPNVGSQTLHMHMHALHLWCSFSSLDIIHVGPPSKISESMSALKCLLPQSNLLLSISSLLWWWLRTLNEEKLVEEGFGIACLWIPRKLGQLWGMLSSSSGYILKWYSLGVPVIYTTPSTLQIWNIKLPKKQTQVCE